MSHESIVQELHDAVGASRTTLRLETPDGSFPVVAESLAPGIRSIRDDTSIDLRAAPTFQYLVRERALLVQDDCLTAPDAPPPELLAAYGVHAQMLAPVVVDDQLVGIVSVHYAPSPRQWTSEEVALIERAARAARDLLPAKRA